LRKIKSYSRVSSRFAELGIPEVEIPNLLAMQVDSFNDFLQKDVHPQRREKKGLQAVFESTFPIEDNKETSSGVHRIQCTSGKIHYRRMP